MLLRICLIIAILAGGGVVAVNFVMVKKAIETTIAEREDQKTHREAAEKELASTKKTLADTKTRLDATTRTLAQTKSELDSANGKIADLDKKNSDLTVKLKSAEDKRDGLQAELGKWEQLHLTPEQVIGIQDDLKKTKVEIAGVNAENKLLLAKRDDLQEQLDRLRGTNEVVVEPLGLKGNVVAVDPKYGFVVLDIGKDKGVLANGIMMVAREGKLIGKVQIARVDKTQSVANILPAWSRGEVMERDQVLD